MYSRSVLERQNEAKSPGAPRFSQLFKVRREVTEVFEVEVSAASSDYDIDSIKDSTMRGVNGGNNNLNY
jgi:hypothetical protein